MPVPDNVDKLSFDVDLFRIIREDQSTGKRKSHNRIRRNFEKFTYVF